ncbi:MAG: universal stress protein [Methylophaga sp.]
MSSKVIACLDSSPFVESVTDGAAWASKTLNAPLTLLHVLDHEAIEQDNTTSSDAAAHKKSKILEKLAEVEKKRHLLSREKGQLVLDFAEENLKENHGIDGHKRLVEGEFIDVLADLRDELRLLVVGKRGESSEGEDLGSHLNKLIRASHRPTMVVTEKFVTPEKIMIAFDGSETMVKAINTVANSQLFKALECHVVMVGAETDEHREQLNWAETTLIEGGLTTKATLLVENVVDKSLSQYATDNNIDMMVMGAYSHTRFRQLLTGSHTATLLKQTNLTLLILR